MSQFQGSNTKVRCIDCTKLSGSRCEAKDVKVSPKKKRRCSSYNFSGEYSNSQPLESRYVPYIDGKTKKTLKSLLNMGVVPVAEDGTPLPMNDRAGFAHTKSFPMPLSTATATQLDMKPADEALLSHPGDNVDKLIWAPENE